VTIISGKAAAGVLHVPADYPSIQAAIDVAASKDTVLVSPGTYFENLDFKGKAITVTSAAGAEVTIIDGQRAGAVVNFGNGEDADSILAGFTLQNGYSTWGSGISLIGSSPTIVRNIIQYNDEAGGYWGAGIGGWSSSPIIEQNLFRYNRGDSQFLTGVIAFVNYSSPLVANNLFVSNSCRAINMTLPTGNSPIVINNTIVGNSVGIRVDGRVDSSGQFFFNNILYGNSVGLEVDFGSPPVWQNNLVFGGTLYQGTRDQTGTSGNISVNPLFVESSRGDYHLLGGSPCIDAGFNGAPMLPATDFDDGPRILSGQISGPAIVDIGAYEFNQSNSVASFPTIVCPIAQTVQCGTAATVTVTVGDADGDSLTIVWNVGGVSVQTNTVPGGIPPTVANVSFTSELPLGTNLIDVAVTDNATNTATCSTFVTVVDSIAPVIATVSAFPNVLWPPNHKMMPVNIRATTADNCSESTWSIIAVQSSDPVDHKASPDWEITGEHTVSLRAERSSASSERVYSVIIQAKDLSGNVSTPKAVIITVPRNQGSPNESREKGWRSPQKKDRRP
jgi:hypothetical protein